MTSDADNSPSDEPEPSSDGGSNDDDRSGWGETGVLVASLLASAALHLGGVGGIHYLVDLGIDLEADIQWLNTSDELTGLGHRVRNRFADIEQPLGGGDDESEDESESESTGPRLDEQKLEKALEGSYEPPDVPDPDPSARSRPPPEQTDRTPPADPSTDASDPPTESDEDDTQPFENIGNHRALDRQGPNNLPDMRSFAPGNARMSALIRVDRIRDQPYADVVKKILRAVPDYRLLLGVPEVDPVRDMDWFFMASPNPRYIQHTFLAVRHRLSNERLTDLLDARYPDQPAWETYESLPVRDLVPDNPHYRDSRRILLAGEGLTLVAKDNLLDEIARPLSEDAELVRSADGTDSSAGPDSSGDAAADRPTLIEGLMRLHQVARRDETIVLLSARKLVFALPGVGRLPRFESVRLAVTRPDHPTLDIDLQFRDDRRASEFARRCPALRTAIDDAIPFSGAMGLSSMLSALDCRADGAFVNVHGDFTVEEVSQLGDLLYPFIPRPPVLEELPNPPREEESTAESGDADTGVQHDKSGDAGNRDAAPSPGP